MATTFVSDGSYTTIGRELYHGQKGQFCVVLSFDHRRRLLLDMHRDVKQ
jgi:hypothetical protein